MTYIHTYILTYIHTHTHTQTHTQTHTHTHTPEVVEIFWLRLKDIAHNALRQDEVHSAGTGLDSGSSFTVRVKDIAHIQQGLGSWFRVRLKDIARATQG